MFRKVGEILCDYCWLVSTLSKIFNDYGWFVRELGEILSDYCWLVGKLHEILENYISQAHVASPGPVWPRVASCSIGPTYVLEAIFNYVRV